MKKFSALDFVLVMMVSGSVFAADAASTAGGVSSGDAAKATPALCPCGKAPDGTAAWCPCGSAGTDGAISTTAIVTGVVVAGLIVAAASSSSSTTHH